MRLGSDDFLDKYLLAYDQWLAKGLISFSSRVIPLARSFEPSQRVVPGELAWELLAQAESLAVQDCVCRSHYQRCDHPRDVCLLMDGVADKLTEKGAARRICLDEARAILDRAERSGLVHLCLYMPDHRVFALCSCCVCCCHDLQLVMRYGRQDLLVRSEYRAVTDGEACSRCGECVTRCPFHARDLDENGITLKAEVCLGCGLCVSVCPSGAVAMVRI